PARARATWSSILGEPPAALVAPASRPAPASPPAPASILADHVRLAPTADALLLADVGDDPLLAARRSGAGLVLAWTSDLGGSWTPPPIAAALLTELDRLGLASTTELSVVADDGAAPGAPDQLLVRVSTLAGDPPPTLTVEPLGPLGPPGPLGPSEASATSSAVHLPLLPVAPGLGLARLPAPRAPSSISAASSPSSPGRRLRIAPRDPEHAHLGVDPALASLVRPAPFTAASRPPRLLIPALSLAIVLLLLALRAQPARRTSEHQ
ncbi:MAG TPA: hypothetical protein VHE35_04740, partial [Kofleriaceae bacterium]|nr:hypothetical protein [Kofleriaceae bacterium]